MKIEKTLNKLAEECYQRAKKNGWYDGKESTFPEKLCLIHSEVSEALEEFRNGKGLDEVYFVDGNDKPEGIPIELADILIRVFDLCGRYDIDIGKAVLDKLIYNEQRSYRHGNKKL